MKKLEGGTVEISVKRKEGALQFMVQDDGAGMSEKQLKDLLTGLDNNKDSRSVGIRNIHMRLEKLYGGGTLCLSGGQERQRHRQTNDRRCASAGKLLHCQLKYK